MSEMYDRNILEILQTATRSAVAQSDVPTLPIANVGLTFDIPDDQKYLEFVWLPNNTADFWGDEKNYRGSFRLILHWSIDTQGAYPPMDILASICRYFAKDNLLSGVQICDNPDASGVLTGGADLLYPATVRYQCFRP